MGNPLTPSPGFAEALCHLARAGNATPPGKTIVGGFSPFLAPTPGFAEALGSLARAGGFGRPSSTLLGDSSFLSPGASPLANLLGAPAPAPVAAVWWWQYVRRRFGRLLGNLEITPAQREDGETKQANIRACLNRHYWLDDSQTRNSSLIG